MKEYREISKETNIPQRMFDLYGGGREFLNPTGYEVWTDEDPIPMYEYEDSEQNLYYAR